MKKQLLNEIINFFKELLDDDNINYIKLSKSFQGGFYSNEKRNEPGTILNFQISDGEFVFSININKDKDNNITMFNIKKDSLWYCYIAMGHRNMFHSMSILKVEELLYDENANG